MTNPNENVTMLDDRSGVNIRYWDTNGFMQMSNHKRGSHAEQMYYRVMHTMSPRNKLLLHSRDTRPGYPSKPCHDDGDAQKTFYVDKDTYEEMNHVHLS